MQFRIAQFSFDFGSRVQRKHAPNIDVHTISVTGTPPSTTPTSTTTTALIQEATVIQTPSAYLRPERRHWLSQTRSHAGLQGNQSALNNSPEPEMRSRERLALNEPLLAPCHSFTEWKDGREKLPAAAAAGWGEMTPSKRDHNGFLHFKCCHLKHFWKYSTCFSAFIDLDAPFPKTGWHFTCLFTFFYIFLQLNQDLNSYAAGLSIKLFVKDLICNFVIAMYFSWSFNTKNLELYES